MWKPQTGGIELPSGVYIHIYIHTYIHARPVEGHPGLCTHIPGRMQDIRVYIHTCIQVAGAGEERSAAGRGGSLINLCADDDDDDDDDDHNDDDDDDFDDDD